MYVFLTIVLVIIFVVLLTFGLAGLSGAPWVPTRRRDVARFLKLAKVKPGDKVCDLGCGDGRILLESAAIGAKAIGYEISIIPLVLVYFNRWRSPYRDQIEVKSRDFWQADMSDVDVVFTFLVPATLGKLSRKMAKMKPGTRVINAVWPVPGWEVVEVDTEEGQAPLYLYIIDK
ncbi:MAG: hypothetical protein KAT58_12365 [candidate division Zixibacteria bacterium]|nr:hypothetical protein [candidate division Zixibacteria bacterium]